MEREDTLIGLTLDEARQLGYTVRATIIDKKPQMGTCDYRPERINVALEDGKIIMITGNG